MIRKGATGTAAAIAFSVIDADGNPVNDRGPSGTPWNDVGDGTTDEVDLFLPGDNAFGDSGVDLSRIMNIGSTQGIYLYLLSAPETANEGLVAIRSAIATYENREHWDQIVDVIGGATVMEANAHAKARTFAQRERINFSIIAGYAPSDLFASPYFFRNNPGGVDTKDRAAYTMVNGVRTPTDFDGDE